MRAGQGRTQARDLAVQSYVPYVHTMDRIKSRKAGDFSTMDYLAFLAKVVEWVVPPSPPHTSLTFIWISVATLMMVVVYAVEVL